MNNFIDSNKYLSIGIFSKLSGISRKNLIYYDNIGILKPLIIKDNGYRYYSYNQLDEVSIIMTLKELGIPLKEIKSYIEDISPNNLLNLINNQKKKILEELNRLNQMNYIIEKRTDNISIISTMNCNKIFLEYCDEELIFLGPEAKFYSDNLENDFINFLNYASSKNLVYGYPLGVYADYDDLSCNENHSYNYFYKIHPNLELIQKTVKPSGFYVIAYDNSYLADNINIFYKIEKFIRSNKLSPCGNIYIENISDEIITKDPDRFFSKISVKVTKAPL
ncbi:DNA-binding transcriptional MerR regulator [Clostridium punense]|uniref:DNA-binding transcriptional MerR regulator n=1 Tax=Clostridium punense TaxID=1054297 RepID=A0ABS4K6N1_9CLOT|nr:MULTISPECIES: MerR family transcriptional regulator [Clostridium]EQB85807.1 hypothetical protein M918_17615 [Clostridium sp. BL8]MBP2023437.1 DNA-binding transcriptional MerR regulator [Clostridium punense]